MADQVRIETLASDGPGQEIVTVGMDYLNG